VRSGTHRTIPGFSSRLGGAAICYPRQIGTIRPWGGDPRVTYRRGMRTSGGSLAAAAVALGVLVPAVATVESAGATAGTSEVARRAAPSMTLSPAYPLAGSAARLRVTVPTRGQRSVQLLRLVNGRWTKVTSKLSTTTGVAVFTVTTPRTVTTYRAFAPRVAAKRLAAVTTSKVVLRPTFPPVVGTSQEAGLGEYPFVTATGTHIAYTGTSDQSTFAARLHTISGHVDQVASEKATGASISGDGSTMLFDKGGQGFWDESWGLVRRVDGTATTVWAQRTGEESPSIDFEVGGVSADGQSASFTAIDPAVDPERIGVYLLDGTSHSRVAWAESAESDIAPDGSCIGFETDDNLVPQDDDGKLDAYIWLRASGTVELVQRAADGNGASYASGRPSMSNGCRYVAWEQQAAYSSWQVWVWDRVTNQRRMVSHAYDGKSYGDNSHASVSGDGSYIAFESTASLTSDKDSGNYDVFLWNKTNGGLTLLTPTAGPIGAGLHPEISDDGRHVAFDGAPKNCQSPCDRRIYLWSRSS
jgi:hypothetical protein